MPMIHAMGDILGAGWLLQEATAAIVPARRSIMLADNIFLKIVNKQIPARIIHEDDQCLAFHDVNPQAPVHVLIIPRKVIATHADIKPEDGELLGHLHLVAAQLAEKLGIGDGYRLVLNCKERAGQTVPHLHLHLLGGRNLMWPPG
jgi:histidine triad (HIT) family protein